MRLALLRQRAGLVPDRARHADPSEIVQITRHANGAHVVAQTEHAGSGGCKIANASGVAVKPRALEINEIAEGSCHVGQLILLDPTCRLRLDVEHSLVGVDLVEVGKQFIGAFDQQLGEIGVELRSRPPQELRYGNIGIRVRGEHHRSQGHLHQPRGQWDLLACGAREFLAIPHREHV